MNTITQEIIIEFIQKNNIELNATQSKLCLPVIDRIFKKMSAGIKFLGIKVESGMICDGHHRYIASLLADFPLERIPGKITGATITVDWELVVFEKDDWDTPTKIKMLNEQDAEYNHIGVEKVEELLK